MVFPRNLQLTIWTMSKVELFCLSRSLRIVVVRPLITQALLLFLQQLYLNTTTLANEDYHLQYLYLIFSPFGSTGYTEYSPAYWPQNPTARPLKLRVRSHAILQPNCMTLSSRHRSSTTLSLLPSMTKLDTTSKTELLLLLLSSPYLRSMHFTVRVCLLPRLPTGQNGILAASRT